MNNENNNQQDNQLKDPRPDLQKEKTPLQMYNELKVDREKERKEFAQKDKDYQIQLIKIGEKLDRTVDELTKAKNAEEIAKTKYWASKESDYRDAVETRQNTAEGIIVNMLYEVLDEEIKDTEHLKNKNIWHI
ncbi:hypothetical protein [endosymbiont GvMRE of Glomus versiforme]|uniref:hypothetical protein n=1 Tax=endosymbiont GvMRE of Glomus versiforme TaxID=2039283 RepID=UPI0011C48B55|nr:hypothetical protein [endosymbiont GvMRE of Glomus versiforme]